MPIDLKVAGDENSCRATAQQLTSLADGIHNGGTAFHTARSESENLWHGSAGDAFRDRMQPIGQHTDDIANQSRTAGQALHEFADDLTTVKARMNQARQIAQSAGLLVNGDSIADAKAPPPVQGPAPSGGQPAMTPEVAQARADSQRQQQAYQQAQQTVSDARKLEQNAHNELERKMTAWQTMLKDASDQKYWLVAGVGTGSVGTAIARANKWAEVAQARGEQAQIWRSVADRLKDPYDISRSAAQAGVYEKDAAKFESLLKSDSTLTAGLRGTKIGDLLKASVDDIPGVTGKLGSVAEKIPVVGGLLALGQTGYDIAADKDKSVGAVAKHVGADMGGFVAGTAATEGALALAGTVGLAGGPVTLAAVGIGIGVAYGVGEVVNHWPEISHWAGDTASDIGHGVENAGKAVGHFFSSIF